MNQIELQTLLEASWRRPLTTAEEAAIREWCQQHPAARADVEADLELSRSLHQLPDVPVSSNFVSQVWLAVDREESAAISEPGLSMGWVQRLRRWLPRVAVGGALASLMIFGWWQHDLAQRAEVAAGLEVVSGAGEVPDPAMLNEFDAIQLMSQASTPVDMELLSALR